MAITRQKKEEMVERISRGIKDAKTIVFANFKGLTVGEVNEVRKALRAQDIGYRVVKKTLLKRGLDSAGFSGEMPELSGEVAVAYGSDELAPARELSVFVKKFPEHLSFMGGVFAGSFVSREEIIGIAMIPGLETLRGMFAQVISSPRQRFASVLSEVAKTKN